MKALILDAGKGTRLAPLTNVTPKSLLDVKRKPVLEHILENMAESRSIKNAYLMHRHTFKDQFEKFNKYYNHPDLNLELISDDKRNPERDPGSIGGIAYVVREKKIDDDLLVVGGDNLYDFKINDFVNFFIKNGRKTTIAAYDFEDKEEVAQKFGVIELEEDGIKIKGFEEKPSHPRTALASTLCYAIPKENLSLTDKGIFRENAGELIKYLVEKGEVNAYTFRGKWFDIGTFRGLDKARNDF